jgi:hypothetical protein
MSDLRELLEDIERAPDEPERPTETLWQCYLRQVSLEESRRYQALEFARLTFECPPEKFVEVAAAIDAFLRDGRQIEAKKLKAVEK